MGPKLTVELLRKLVRYDPESGRFTPLRPGVAVTRYGGRAAVIFRGVKHIGARLAILDQYGSLPPKGMVVDHIDGNPSNDRIGNLRVVTHLENSRNRRRQKNNTSGVAGVDFEPDRGTWGVRIRIGGGKRLRIGRYRTLDEALAARIEAVKKHHGAVADMTIYPLLA